MPFLFLSPGGTQLFGHGLTDAAQFAVQILNFIIFLGLLIYFLKVPAARFFQIGRKNFGACLLSLSKIA